MKEKIGFISTFIFFMLIGVVSVCAEERKYEAYGEIFRFDISEQGVNLINPGEEEQTGGWTTKSYNYYLDDFEDYIANIDSSKPFAMYICEKVNSGQGPGATHTTTKKYYFFPSEVEKQEYETNYYEQNKVYDTLSDCDYFEEKISGSNEKVCPAFDLLKKNINEILEEYKSCSGDNCDIEYKSIFDEKVGVMLNVCDIILKYTDYKSECAKECLNVEKTIKELKKNSGIKDDLHNNGQCGFSQRLLYWIANIVRWIKYIIPVAVIVLGILDFIKAVGADKDDEMKKAQGRFVKRLIAAALIFIIPFIIEFVLDKMGFGEYISGCGIIDL